MQQSILEIDGLKNQIIDKALILASVIGIIVYILSLTRISETGFELAFLTDFLVLTIVLCITIFRKKLNLAIKSYVAIFAIYVVFLFDSIRLGIFSADNVLIILIPFLSLLSLSLKETIGIFVFTIISFFVIAFLHLTGHLVAPPQDKITLSAWLINIFLIVVVSLIVLIIQTRFNFTYTQLIHDLEKKKQLISEKERNYREIFNSATDAIFIYSVDGEIVDVNDSMLTMFGYTRDEIQNLGMDKIQSVIEGFENSGIEKIISEALNGNTQLFDWQVKRKNGNLFWVEVAIKKTSIGGNDRLLAIVRDINDKKEDALQLALYKDHLEELVVIRTQELIQSNHELKTVNDTLASQKEELQTLVTNLQLAQDKLVQSEKMASLGVLAAGIAHEINNPLNFIQGGLYGLEAYIEDNLHEQEHELMPMISGIAEGVRRTSNIVMSLNHYSHETNKLDDECHIGKIIENCLVILHSQIKPGIEIINDISCPDCIILGNEGRLHQVFLNLITNSLQAIETKGKIHIRTAIDERFAVVSIKDNGKGIRQQDLPRIFDPFFTTKSPGMGTGLGLSISLRIVKDHGGIMECFSIENEGTEMIVRIPLKKDYTSIA